MGDSSRRSGEQFPVDTEPNLASILNTHYKVCSVEVVWAFVKKCPLGARLKQLARHGQLGNGPRANPEHAGGTPAQPAGERRGIQHEELEGDTGERRMDGRVDAVQIYSGCTCWK